MSNVHSALKRPESESRETKSDQISSSSSTSRESEYESSIMYNPPEVLSEDFNRSKAEKDVLLMAKTSLSTVTDALPSQAEDKSNVEEVSVLSPVPPEIDDYEVYLNTITEKTENSPPPQMKFPADKLVIQHMPQINIRPSLTLHKIFDIEIKPTGSFSFRSPTFRNIHYEEMFSPQTKTIAQQTSSTLLEKKPDKVDEVCSCGPQDIKIDLVPVPVRPVPDSEGTKSSSEEFTRFSSAGQTNQSDTDTVQLVSEMSGETSSIATDLRSESEEITAAQKLTDDKVESLPQKTLKSATVSDLKLDPSEKSPSKTDKKTSSKTICNFAQRKRLKAKPDSKSGLPTDKLADQEPTPMDLEIPKATDSALLENKSPVDSETVKISAASAENTGTVKVIPEQVDIFKVYEKVIPEEETKRPEPRKEADQACVCAPEDAIQRREAVDVQRDQLPVQLTQAIITASANSIELIDAKEKSEEKFLADDNDVRPSQLTELLEKSRSVISESKPNIKYMNKAYHEQTVSEKQFGPHPESSTSAPSVPEVEPEPSSVPKLKIHFDSDFYEEVECACNLITEENASERQIPVTSADDAADPHISIQKSSESVYVLTHDVSIQTSPVPLAAAAASPAPVKKKHPGERGSGMARGSRVRQTRKRSTFKSPLSSKISYSSKSNEKNPILKASSTQKQSGSRRSRGSVDSDRPKSTSESLGVSTSEASKRYKTIPELTILEHDDQPPTVMSAAVQYQIANSLEDAIYPKLHKSRNCKDLDTSSSELDGYNKLHETKLSDDTTGDFNFNRYNMYCGDSFDHMRNYQATGVNKSKLKEMVRHPKMSSASNSSSSSHRLQETLSEGEIKCRCSISIGELHICRYVQQIKSRAKVSGRPRDGSPSRCKWDTSKSESSPKIDSTEPSSDT